MKIIKAINIVILALCIKISLDILFWMANVIRVSHDFYVVLSKITNFYSVYLVGLVNVLVIAAFINFFICLYNQSEQLFSDDNRVRPETAEKQ